MNWSWNFQRKSSENSFRVDDIRINDVWINDVLVDDALQQVTAGRRFRRWCAERRFVEVRIEPQETQIWWVMRKKAGRRRFWTVLHLLRVFVWAFFFFFPQVFLFLKSSHFLDCGETDLCDDRLADQRTRWRCCSRCCWRWWGGRRWKSRFEFSRSFCDKFLLFQDSLNVALEIVSGLLSGF